MCQIITGSAHKVRSTLLETPGLIGNLYKNNPDGLGAMFHSRRGLRVVKVLPESAAEARAMIITLPDDARNLALHWRMRTHGLVDKLNCHPYDVVPGEVALMHNGILNMGNDSDVDKSDTWHFIKDYLAGMVKTCPAVIHEPQFSRMVGDFIDNNRFVLMDAEGRMVTINADQGLHHDGMWFANTYSWNPSLLIKGYRAKYNWRGQVEDDELDGWAGFRGDPQWSAGRSGTKFDIGAGTSPAVDMNQGDVVLEFNTGNFDVHIQYDGDVEGYSYLVTENATGDLYDEASEFDSAEEAEAEASEAARTGEAYLKRGTHRDFVDSGEFTEHRVN